MDDKEIVFVIVALLALVIAFIYLIIYVVIPLILSIAGVGAACGGGVSLYNYGVAFKNNVEPERIMS